jgi:hypothetical protein
VKYMLIIYGNDELWSSLGEAEARDLIARTDAHNNALLASGEMVGAYGIAGQDKAKQVHVADGARLVTDGPYIEAKEYIGSFTIVDVDSEERALQIAAENPASRFRHIEVRPILHEAPTTLETGA